MRPLVLIGQPEMAILLRLTSEAYFLFDRDAGTAKERWEKFLLVHEAARVTAERAGIDDVQCWLPPEVPKGFERRLKRLGWCPNEWRCFWRSTR